MAKLDSQLEPGLSIFDSRRLFSDRAIWTFLFVGLAVVITVMTGLWDLKGHMRDAGAGYRFFVVLVIALYGAILGWMIFPRIGRLNDL